MPLGARRTAPNRQYANIEITAHPEPRRISRHEARRLLLIAAAVTLAIGGACAIVVVNRGTSHGTVSVETPASNPDQRPVTEPADGNAQPARIGVAGPDGNLVGYADLSALQSNPDFAVFPDDPEAAVNAWLHTPIPVTKAVDPSSELIGYDFPTVGFVDLATYNRPTFDLDSLLPQAAAKEQLEVQRAKAAGLIK